METLNTKRLLELFSRKLGLLEEVLAYSKEQRKLSYRDHQSRYDNLIESRAKCLEDLGKLEVVLERNLNRLNDKFGAEADFQDELYEQNSKVTAMLKEIIELDRENNARMLKERSDLQARLQNVNRGRKGVAGYKGNNQYSAAGVFTDNRG